MASVSDATSRLQESFDLERAESRAQHQRELQEKNRQQETELKARNEEYNTRLKDVRQDAQADVRKMKEELYDSKGRSTSRDYRDMAQQKNDLMQYADEARRQADLKVDQVERSMEHAQIDATNNQNSKVEAALAAQNRSHLDELNYLHDELARYRGGNTDLDHEKSKTRAQEIHDYEAENINERKRLVDAYEQSIGRMNVQRDEMGEHYKRQLSETTSSVYANARDQVQKQKDEFIRSDQEKTRELRQLENHFDNELKHEQQRNDRSTSVLVDNNAIDRDRAIASNNEAYRAYLKDNKTKNDYEQKTRDDEIRTLKTTADPLKVSPSVVDRIERKAEGQYNRQLEEARKVNSINLKAERDRDLGDRQYLREHFDESLTRQTRDMQRGQDVEKKQFMSAYTDLQAQKEDDQSNLEKRYTQSIDRNEVKHGLDTQLMQKRNKDALEEQRLSLQEGHSRTEDDWSLKAKEQNREWSWKYNDLRRDYERKMNEERDQNVAKLAELRLEYDKRLRDTDRTANRALDDRVKMYEHQLKQQEVAFKEKERFLTERYEEELDRMKQTNARLIQKKS